jgi:hypothetical protein
VIINDNYKEHGEFSRRPYLYFAIFCCGRTWISRKDGKTDHHYKRMYMYMYLHINLLGKSDLLSSKPPVSSGRSRKL